ncbi:MFS transporter [Sphingomonas sp. BGYR3]|uniref:MFS transporter n=1 Tax=Sphingomonas sp. BGYR3 TaxID=2975483 RepID=UPI0021A37F6E|nr:MFS transporter [Sphingomonas sp. BGYR3]MDG5488671.1 MFS transporter [Sphingomonas sp. BGYR3]
MHSRKGQIDRDFALLFAVMLVIAAGNTALQSVLPALGRSLGVADSAVAAAFSVSALLWVVAAPFWARRADRQGRRAMVLLGIWGFTASILVCGLFLMAGINGWIAPVTAFVFFVGGRLIYGMFGAAAPPAVQAIVAARTSRADRTRALALIGSAFGLGTILGPAFAPYLVLGSVGGVEIGLSGPAFMFALVGAVVGLTVMRLLPVQGMGDPAAKGAANSYPSIGGQSSGAAVTAALADAGEQLGYFDPRIRIWTIIGLVAGHAQAMAGQAIGFLIIDRLALAPSAALEPTGIVLMMGAGAALLVQWGIIPILNLSPRALVLWGSLLAAIGCAWIALANGLYPIATGFALASMGFGFVRPGFTAGASLAVGASAQGSVAGKVTSINGAAFVLGPSIGVAMYELWRPLPYGVAAAALLLLLGYALIQFRRA